MQELKEDGEISKFTPPLFILLSTFMTWSLSKSLHPKIPDLPFSEKDYRKRTPHPNYQMHYELEEEVIRVKSSGEIDAIILTCGIPYGHEESVFSYFFETAVNCNVDVPVYYGSGQNFFPVIHVENIGEIVREVIKKSEKITLPFLFAKDPISFYKKDVIKAITRGFGAECYKIMPEEFSFLEDAITQDIYDQTMANIYMESCCPLFPEEDIKWKYTNGFVEDMEYIVKEFTDAKNIKPLNIVVFGSSLQDMENLPQRLSQYYNSLYLNPDVAVQDYVSKMLDKITKFEEQKNTEDATQQRIGLELEGDPVKVPDLKIEVTEEHCEDYNLENSLEFFRKLNVKHIDDISKLTKTQNVSILYERMKSRVCLIHGYVLDDFPKTLEEAQSLFSTDDRYTFQSNDSSGHPNLPDYVVYLNQVEDAIPESAVTGDNAYRYSKEGPSFTPDNTVKVLSQDDIQPVNIESKTDTKIENTVEGMIEGQNNEANSPEMAVIDFFLEKNKNCKLIKLDINESNNSDRAFNEVIESIIQTEAVGIRSQEMSLKKSQDIGRHFQETNILQVDERKSIGTAECQSEKVMDEVETETITKSQEGKSSKLKNLEEMKIAINSCPYISYLISYMYPTLTNALLAVTEQRPEDPLDFLAEYLFKNNPDGKMMDPTRAKIEEEMRNRDLGFPNIDSKACLS
ncbi:adenylate kinase 7-like [Homalodisca vitripennis]|uniref:adenylate kinase 7-like n=1 Tax=Homalodisca vitripennis TaxID=197043 RepID=UPI001EEC817A|nr:adenylate kinase 7-like [Homalodisca vitripennis]